MTYKIENRDIVIDGWETGIATSPHKGTASMKGVDISTEPGVAACSYSRVKQSQTGTASDVGTITRVNTNTVSITGINLLVGSVITILVDSGTGLSGDYYYLSTGKLYAGALPPSDPDSASAVTGINAGTATFKLKYPMGAPYQSATEPYNKTNSSPQQRYYILDTNGSVWCHDTATLSNWDTPLWFFVGSLGAGASGLAVFNGWLTLTDSLGTIWWKLTSTFNKAWSMNLYTVISSMKPSVALAGSNGYLYWSDGSKINSIVPENSTLSGQRDLQSYSKLKIEAGGEIVTNGTFTGGSTGWTVGAGWAYSANTMTKNADGTGVLSQVVEPIDGGAPAGRSVWWGRWNPIKLTFTISNLTVGTVTPSYAGISGTAVSANGTYTQWFDVVPGTQTLAFTPSNTSRFTIDDVSIIRNGVLIDTVVGGVAPYNVDNFGTTPVPVTIHSTGTLPTDVVEHQVYWLWLRYFVNEGLTTIEITKSKTDFTGTGGNVVSLEKGATGTIYINTFDPGDSGTKGSTPTTGADTWSYNYGRLVLPFNETINSMAELGDYLIVGGSSNIIYPWNQLLTETTPQSLLFMPESGTYKLLTVNNTCYIFAGNKGNVYLTNGSSISLALTVPDYLAGIPGTPSSYIEPYFTWGDAAYVGGRIYFSILDQTSTKSGSCGGIFSFVPTQNFFTGEDTGMALRLENQSSYGTYNGYATVILPALNQKAKSTQYWSGWVSDFTTPTYGIDFTDTIPQTAIIETDLIPTGTLLGKRTFENVEYKLASPLLSGESVTVEYRQNGTDAYTACGTMITDSSGLSGYTTVNFENGQWLQLRITLTPQAQTTSSFVPLKEVRVR